MFETRPQRPSSWLVPDWAHFCFFFFFIYLKFFFTFPSELNFVLCTMTRPVSCFFPPSGGKCVFPLLLLQAEINITTSRLCAYPARKKITHKILGDTLKLNEQKGEEWTLSSGDLSCVVLWAACRDEGNGALQQKKKETDSGYVLHSTETRTTHGKERKRADECNRRRPTEGRGKFFSI